MVLLIMALGFVTAQKIAAQLGNDALALVFTLGVYGCGVVALYEAWREQKGETK